ncbi:MAG: hypothetical protein K2X69_15715 [Silvanigrellaceae bacterium]|nr:hypothetical protein [Silvanigrellaceae bacterium]
MTINDLKKIQNFFLETVTSNPNINIHEILEKKEMDIFEKKTAHRLEAYRVSYYSRISSVFSETIFKLASLLFGKNLIKDFLIEYFYQNPSPNHMEESIRNFPNFLEEQEEIQECPFVPDFIRLCINISDILAAPNPNELLLIKNTTTVPQPNEIFLQEEHILLQSQWPIFQMYCSAKNLSELSELESTTEELLEEKRIEELTSINNTNESILIFKSCEWSLETILIPEEFISIMDSLSKKQNIEDAIEQADINEDLFDISKLSNWMSLMTKHSAFMTK